MFSFFWGGLQSVIVKLRNLQYFVCIIAKNVTNNIGPILKPWGTPELSLNSLRNNYYRLVLVFSIINPMLNTSCTKVQALYFC